MRTSHRTLLLTLLALVAGLVAVNAAPSAHHTKRAVRSRATPFELPRNFQAQLGFSFGQENIDISAAPVPSNRRIVFTQEVDFGKVDPARKNVLWSRLVFDPTRTVLRPSTSTANTWGENLPGDQLRITSLQDNSVQYLNDRTIKEWNHRSAFFNGGRVRVELLADRSITRGRPSVIVQSVIVNDEQGFSTDPITLPPPNSLCNAADLRRPSRDPRSGRIFPVGCTGWTGLPNGCQLTAGHCFDGVNAAEQVLQANVPQSIVITVNGQRVGVPRHPPASQQWAIDTRSVQFALVSPLDVADFKDAQDWATFGTYRNPNTGLTFLQAAGNRRYTLARVDPRTGQLAAGQATKGSSVTITGYGIVRDTARRNLRLTQQTHSGPITDFPSPNHIDHRADTEGGNSGSAIAIGDLALGIHTNGGCDTTSATSANWGSSISMPALQAALRSQRGVCA
ncbi:hypothetical protein BCR44DRAFT_1501302 [Catenaria anguillulae PL171]|uniref:Serine protease n=1 Tax=Catenaria anguillulae PL171 TaxID=765915 RepID=A0A1Y2HHQ7_9FUNG|nr:hypothetical protein BCR44DRAFT_1501302 [Catenaria anguillulae PL171]